MAYSKPLIITDNIHQCMRFIQLLKKMEITTPFHFAISRYSDVNSFKQITSGVLVLDLKNEHDVDFIIHHYDLVISLHCKQLFPEKLYSNVKALNVHPGYNPVNRGWYPQVFAILNKKAIGATIHEIDGGIDHGAILARAFVDKYEWDTSATLYNRILEKEIELIEANLLQILNGTYPTFPMEHEGELHLKKDFNKLLELDLLQQLSLGDAIDLLRALTHDPYRNAYFYTSKGEKVFVNLRLEKADE